MKTIKCCLSAVVLVAEAAVAQMNLSSLEMKPVNMDLDQETYASINHPVKHFSSALKRAEEIAGGKLITRGEAHLTILTPPEYMKLNAKFRKQLLHEVQHLDWSKSPIKPVCIGHAKTDLNGKSESAFYVVVEADAIVKIREKYHLGEFYPHITLGYTKRDLHIEDGVKKDLSSCVVKFEQP